MPQSSRKARTFLPVVIAALIAAAPFPRVLADPLPTEENWSGGRIMPARAVPVDMTAEQLRVDLKPLTGLRQFASQPGDTYSLCVAEVAVEYNLKADRRTRVPILFPISGGAAGLDFRVNGSPVRTHLVWDVDILRAYDKPWRSTIDRIIGSDAGLRQIADDARRLMDKARADLRARQEHAPQMPAGTSPPEPRLETGGSSSRLRGQLEVRLSALGVNNASDIVWGLTHYLADDWEDTYAHNSMMPGSGPGLAERVRLLSERDIAVHLNPQSPDPIALWETPLPNPVLGSPMVFVAAELLLREGDNAFSVRYTQPVSFVNMRRTVTLENAGGKAPHPMSSGAQVCDFRFVLRTARFWRSFGTLAVQVNLPAGTRFARCTLPEAQVALEGDAPAVTYSGAGLPDQNLSVRFAAFDAEERNVRPPPSMAGGPQGPGGAPVQTSLEQAPPISLRAQWQAVVSEQKHAFAHALPVADANVVVATAGTDGVICDRKSGKIITRFTSPGEVTGLKLQTDRILIGFGKKPTGGYGHYGQAGLAVLDRASGGIMSQVAVEGDDYRDYQVEPLPAGKIVVAAAQEGPVIALDTTSGKLAWQKPFQSRSCVLSAEAEAGGAKGLVFVAGRPPNTHQPGRTPEPQADTGIVAALKLSDGVSAWERHLGYDPMGLALSEGKLFVAANATRATKPFIACLRVTDGNVLWRHDLTNRSGFNYVHRLLLLEGKLVVVDDQSASGFSLDPEPALRWTVTFPTQQTDPPGVLQEAVYVYGYRGIGKIDLLSGTPLWVCKQGSSGKGPCSADGGQVFALQGLGGLLTSWEEPAAGVAARAPAAATSADGTPAPVYGQAPDRLVEAALRLPDHGWPEVPRTSVYAAVWRNGEGVGSWPVTRPTDPPAPAPGPRPSRRVAVLVAAAAAVLLALATTAVLVRVRRRRPATPPS